MAKLPDDAGWQTTAIHGGEGIDEKTRASAPNLVMSTTFAASEASALSLREYDLDDMPWIYTRWGNPTVDQLQRKLALLEGTEACLAFGSGMAATSGLLLGYLSKGDHVIVSDVHYAGSAELVRHTLPRLGIEVSIVDSSEVDNVRSALRDETRMVFVETPANPVLKLTDIEAVAKLCREHGAKLAVDSTFATPIVTRPAELGADFVVHSLTKYIGGHGDALGGAVLASKAELGALSEQALVHFGGVLSPFNAWLIMRGAATLPLRMRAHSDHAMAVARFLEAHPKVGRVLYPGLESHPQHALANRQMKMYSGMVAFQVDDGETLAERMIESLEVIHYAVSLGHHRSLVYWIGADAINESSFGLEGRELERFREFAGAGVMRLSVGLEDPEDLCRDLDRVLGG